MRKERNLTGPIGEGSFSLGVDHSVHLWFYSCGQPRYMAID